MDIHEIRKQMRTKSIYDIPLRVTFYARVSTDSDEQINSLDNQVAYYNDLISKNKKWTFIDGYIDEGLSGMTTKKRENFHNMIKDAHTDKFDLIITKEITRFARNTLDSIQYTRELLSYGVGVFFQNDNINTIDEDSELRLTIMSGIAQDELRKLSSRIKFGHQQAIKSNVVLGNGRIFGYNKKDKRLVINENEAEMVRQLFKLYATNEYSMKQIEDLFWSQGYRNHNGNKIAHSTMSGMISNPKYKGYYVGNKVRIVDMFTKKQKFLPPEEWVMFKDETGEIVPAIVSEELWEAANEVLSKRSNDVKKRQNICNHANLLTSKLYCTQCGLPYYRRDSKDKAGNVNSKWLCSGKIKNGADSCESFAIYESDIKPILHEMFVDASSDIESLIDKYMDMYKSINQNDENYKAIENAKKQIIHNEDKKNKLLDYNVDGKITDAQFLTMLNKCDDEINQSKQEIAELEESLLNQNEFRKRIDKLKGILMNAAQNAESGLIDKNFIDLYIDKIFVTPEDGKLKLEIKVCTDEITEKYLDNIKSRTGHTSLTICPPIEPA